MGEYTPGAWNAFGFTSSEGAEIVYQLHLPSEPVPGLPLFLYMHGAGSKGNSNTHAFNPYTRVLRFLESSEYSDRAVILAPQCPKGGYWTPQVCKGRETLDASEPASPYMKAALELMEKTIVSFSCDRSRLWLYGNSEGAAAVWCILATKPGQFAAACPVAGVGDPNYAGCMKDTSIRIYHGSDDDVVPYKSSRIMYDALVRAGHPDVILHTYVGKKHNIWNYPPEEYGFFDWLFAQHL